MNALRSVGDLKVPFSLRFSEKLLTGVTAQHVMSLLYLNEETLK